MKQADIAGGEGVQFEFPIEGADMQRPGSPHVGHSPYEEKLSQNHNLGS